MSAELNTSMSWYWYCAECRNGSFDFDSEDAAALERDEHNEEEHAMTTDNRTNELNKYAGFLARQGHRRDPWRGVGVKCLCGKLFDLVADHAMHQVDEILRAALVAATRVPVQGEPNDDREALRKEFEYRIRKAVAYGSGLGYRELPVHERADWIQREIRNAVAIASRATVPDAATAAIERIREAVSGHPECDRYSEDDVISCGWKSAYASVIAALDGAPEPEVKP